MHQLITNGIHFSRNSLQIIFSSICKRSSHSHRSTSYLPAEEIPRFCSQLLLVILLSGSSKLIFFFLWRKKYYFSNYHPRLCLHLPTSAFLLYDDLTFLVFYLIYRNATFEFYLKVRQTVTCEVVLHVCCVILRVDKFCFSASLEICLLSRDVNLFFLPDLLYFP